MIEQKLSDQLCENCGELLAQYQYNDIVLCIHCHYDLKVENFLDEQEQTKKDIAAWFKKVEKMKYFYEKHIKDLKNAHKTEQEESHRQYSNLAEVCNKALWQIGHGQQKTRRTK